MFDKFIEYRINPVTRYIITRYEANGTMAATVGERGEYTNPDMAYEVAYALCKADHERLGYPTGDERIKYPQHPRHASFSPNVPRETQ